MDWGITVVWIILIIFGSISAPFSIWQIGCVLRERRRDKMEEKRINAQQELEQMRLKAEMDSRILGSSSVVAENLTAELQSLREEVRQMKEKVNKLESGEAFRF